MLHRLAEALLRGYSRVAPTERGGYRLARLVRRLRPVHQWQDRFRTPDGLVMDLDLGTYPDCCMAYGLYELDTARLIRKLLRPGDHFIDAGANIGYFTLLASRCVGSTGRVDAFEPQPDNRARLIEHIQINQLTDRVQVHPVALSDQAGQATIHYFLDDQANHGCSSLFASPQARTRTATVPTVRADERLPDAQPRLVKIDVEGAEPWVVGGMTRWFASARPPMILAEWNPPQAAKAGVSPRLFLDRIMQAQPRYQVFRVGWRLRPLPMDEASLANLRQENLLISCPD